MQGEHCHEKKMLINFLKKKISVFCCFLGEFKSELIRLDLLKFHAKFVDFPLFEANFGDFLVLPST